MTARPWGIGPEAKEDIAEAIDWYRTRQRGLERAFVAELRYSLSELRAQPRMAPREPKMPKGVLVRRWLLPNFPYVVVFVETDVEYRVIAVAHVKRRPHFWKARMTR